VDWPEPAKPGNSRKPGLERGENRGSFAVQRRHAKESGKNRGAANVHSKAMTQYPFPRSGMSETGVLAPLMGSGWAELALIYEHFVPPDSSRQTPT